MSRNSPHEMRQFNNMGHEFPKFCEQVQALEELEELLIWYMFEMLLGQGTLLKNY